LIIIDETMRKSLSYTLSKKMLDDDAYDKFGMNENPIEAQK
jgi:hypothetical protein